MVRLGLKQTPIITARSSDLPNVAQGDTVTIDSVVYTVVEARDTELE